MKMRTWIGLNSWVDPRKLPFCANQGTLRPAVLNWWRLRTHIFLLLLLSVSYYYYYKTQPRFQKAKS